MSTKTEQLETLFQEVIDRFENDRYVTVSPMTGKASEQYEVTYNVTGIIQKEDKSVQETKSHNISITIPFGFPHFPPSCKPLTPIFHPDFDEAAICIGDFWTRERTLSDVIIYIGRMISGEIHSHENAFNEEALVWYQNNSGRLPFEIVNFTPANAQIHDPSILETPEEEPFDIDVLDDSDFDTDFDLLELEEPDITEVTPTEQVQVSSEGIDIDNLTILLKHKRFYELDQLIRATPKDVPFNGRVGFEKQVRAALATAKKLQREADQFEHKGKPDKALEIFQEVEATVSDYPNIQDSINRALEALVLLGDWTLGSDDSSTLEPPTAPPEEKKKPEPAVETTKLTFFDKKTKGKLRVVPLLISVAVIVLLGIFLFPLFSQKSQLKDAEQAFYECQRLLNNSRFTAAEKKCEIALELTTGFQFFFKNKEKSLLASTIRNVLNSQKMKQGLTGNVLHEGNYIHKSTYDSIVVFKESRDEGDRLLAESNWKAALTSYRKAISLLPKADSNNPAVREELHENMTLAEVNNFMDIGIRFNENHDWKNATTSFQQAVKAAETLTTENRLTLLQRVKPQLSQANFLEHVHLADESFANNKWEKALQNYQKARLLSKQFTLQNPELLKTVNEKIARAELYTVINNGKNAFNQGRWDEAIENYVTAIDLLEENRAILSKTTTDKSRRKLARVMLQASIIRDQQAVAAHLKAKKFTQAISNLRTIDTTISKSEFKNTEEFQAIVKETREAITDVQTKKTFAELTAYLKDNFKVLFTQNYSSVTSDYLKAPVVTFVRKEKDNFLFKLQCTETSQGRPSILLMHYMYYPESKSWRFYDLIN